jgi:hypothetical protein
MKALLLLYLFLLSAATLSLFADDPEGYSDVGGSSSYYPLTVGSQWTYNTRLGRITALVEDGSDDGDVVYRLTSSFGISYDFGFTIGDNEIRNIHRRISALLWGAEYAYVPAVVMFDFPLFDGKEWQWSGERLERKRAVDADFRGTVSGEETITRGEIVYECIVVSITYTDENTNWEELRLWLTPGVGMVKGAISIEGSGVMGVISRIIGSELHLNLLDYTVL